MPDIFGTRPVKTTNAMIRSKLKLALDDGDMFDDILSGIASYRRHIDAWCGDRRAKPLIQFLETKMWTTRRFESDMPPTDFVPKSAKPWPDNYHARFRAEYPSRITVRSM